MTFLGAPEFPLEIFKSWICSVLQSFSAPPNHHVRATAPAIPASLKPATHVFVCEDLSTPLQPLYWGLHLVLQKDDKYFTLQLGAREDKVSKDSLKPVTKVIVPQVPLTRGHPRWLLWIVLRPLQLHLRLGSVLCFLYLAFRLVLCPLLQVLGIIEETFLERPDNQLQLHLLVNLVHDAGGTSVAELKMTS